MWPGRPARDRSFILGEALLAPHISGKMPVLRGRFVCTALHPFLVPSPAIEKDMSFFTILLIAFGLAMDAFAVSIVSGFTIKRLNIQHAFEYRPYGPDPRFYLVSDSDEGVGLKAQPRPQPEEKVLHSVGRDQNQA